MLFPYLEMVHSCVPSELESDTHLELWSISFLKHFLRRWQAQVHPTHSAQNSVLWGADSSESRSPFSVTYNNTLSKGWTMILLFSQALVSPKKRQWAYFIMWFDCFLLKLQSQASVEIGILFELGINLSFLPGLNRRRKSS